MTLLKRTITVVIGLPVVIALVFFGGLPLLIVCCVVALVGLREFYLAFSKKDRFIHVIGYLATAGWFGAIFILNEGHFDWYWLLISLTLFIIVVQGFLVVFFRKLSIVECITTVYGFLYVPFLLSFVVLVRQHELGAYYVWLIFVASFGCDTFAYLTGSLFGKNKLKNTPSPSKSYEGLVGGIIGATVIGFLYGLVVSRFFGDSDAATNIILIATIISFLGAVFSIIGDLAASAVKRHCEIKDFGKLFPGHGGVMDRIDSIVTVAPIVYLVMNAMIWLVA